MFVVDNREAVGSDNPGLHALLIGISEYPYLSKRKDPSPNTPFGFWKVTGPAASALALADWLEKADAAGILALPLKTIRLLWLPSDAEIAPGSKLAEKASTAVDAESVRTAIEQWRDECNSNPKNVAFFYFSGHGVNASPDDVFLAMGDVGRQGDSATTIRRCICVQSIFKAMAPSRKQMNMALKQFYFIDACRTIADIEDPTADTKIGGNSPGRYDTDAERAAPIYFGATSGEPAFADSADGTRFGKALLRVLENSSAEAQADGGGKIIYPINTDSLRVAINNAMGQELLVRGHAKNATLIVRSTAPETNVSVQVLPDEKASNISVDIFNVDQNCLFCSIKPVQPNAYPFKAPIGRYRLEAHLVNSSARVCLLPARTFVGPLERWIVDARS